MKIVSGVLGFTVALIGMGNIFAGSQVYEINVAATPTSNRIQTTSVANPHSKFLLLSGAILLVGGLMVVVAAIVPEEGIALPEPPSLPPARPQQPQSVAAVVEEAEEEDELDWDEIEINDYLNNVGA